jgi:hypothetical protein
VIPIPIFLFILTSLGSLTFKVISLILIHFWDIRLLD